MSQKKLTVMNKVLQSCMIALAATTLFSACQKDKEHLVDLTAVIVDQPVSNAKVYIDDVYGCWQHGDAVKIKSGSNGTESYSLTVAGSDEAATRATILDVTEGAPYTAGYPAANATITGNGTLTIDVPASQSYAEASIYSGAATAKQRIVCPMAAYSPDGSDLKFYNVAAMLAVTVSNSTTEALTLYAVEVESDNAPLSATAVVSVDAEGATITSQSSTSTSVTLYFTSTLTLDASGEATVYLPVLPIAEGDASNLTVHVKATGGTTSKKYTFHGESARTMSIEKDQIGNIPVTLSTATCTGYNEYFWGQGTEDCPFLIENQTDLENLRTLTNAGTSGYVGNTVYYKQTADIDLSSWTTAIGNTSSYAFSANYNGGGHSITNLSLAETDEASYGLFGYAGGGNTIKNLTVSGSITSSYKAGYDGIAGLVGESTAELTIERCTTNVSIIDVATGNGINKMGHAGILGCASGATTIRYCKNTGDITEGTGHYIRGMSSGGILGLNNNASTSIEYCENTGNVLQERTTNTNVNYGKIGGICGQTMTNINISNCTNSGTVRNTGASASTAATGGIIGAVFEPVSGEGGTNTATLDNVRITECTNSGTVALTANTAGFCGGIIGSIGGLACSNLVVNVTVSNCTHKNANVTGVYRVGGIVGFTYAKVGSSLSVSGCKTLGGDSYLITGGTASYTSGIVGFTGSFDINLSVSGCANNIPVTGGTYTSGVVSYVSMGSASTKPVVISNCTNTAAITGISGSTKQNYVGGIAAYLGYHPITVTGCENSGTITGANYTAGIAAYTYGGNTTTATYITNNTNTGVISSSGNYVAGIVAQATKTTLTGCINSEDATVTGTYHVGGIAGNLSQATTISNCKNFADITATSTNASSGVAGLIGSNPSTMDMTYCLNKGNIYLTYANANKAMYVGGLVGYSNGYITASDCGSTGNVAVTNGCFGAGGLIGGTRVTGYNFKNCYCTGNITGNITNSQSVGGIIGCVYYGSSSRCGYIENCYFSGSIDLGGSRTSAMIGDMYGRYNTTGYYFTITSSYAANQYGVNNHANYSISQNGDDEYVTSNGDKKLKEALNDWRTGGNASYSEWVSTDDTVLPHLAWEDE